MKKNKISIIVPIYNIEKYLEQCLESIIAQTYTNLEIILVDDGSKDSSGLICDRYAKKDKRIIVIHEQNSGSVFARKAGLSIAHGEYIGFVDGDDWIEPDFYETLLDAALKSKADFVESGYNVYYESNKDFERHPVNNNLIVLDNNSPIVLLAWMKDNLLCPVRSTLWTKLYKANIIRSSFSSVPDDMSRGDDFIHFPFLLFEANSVCCIDKVGYNYLARANSLSHDNSFEYYVYNQDMLAYLRHIISEKFPKIRKEILKNWRLDIAEKSFLNFLYHHKELNKNFVYYIGFNLKRFFHKQIVLYGAGSVGRDYYLQIQKYEKCKIVAWVDLNYKKYNYEYYKIKPIKYLEKINYDYIIICVFRKELAQSIKESLINMEIPNEKIFWKKPRTINMLNKDKVL